MERKKILIADDDPNVARMLSIPLEKENFEIVTAYDGLETVRKAHEEKPHLIIMDIIMPGLDGYQATERIRNFQDETKLVPILVLTCKGDLEFLFEGLSVTGFLTKPFVIEDVLAKIREVLG